MEARTTRRPILQAMLCWDGLLLSARLRLREQGGGEVKDCSGHRTDAVYRGIECYLRQRRSRRFNREAR